MMVTAEAGHGKFVNCWRWLGLDKLSNRQRQQLTYGALALLLFRFVCAARIPFGNDEVYYWDWGRELLLSYFDHPPMVAWLAKVGSSIGGLLGAELFGARMFVPLLHVVSSLLIYRMTGLIARRSLTWGEAKSLFLLTQLVPAFTIGGIILMPDAGLVFWATVAEWLWQEIWMGERKPTVFAGLLVGLAVGLAGCSKYHAAPILGVGGLLLLWKRRRHFRVELGFWLASLLKALVVLLPVLLWNYRHEWVSFRYQSSHGLGGLDFVPLAGFRTMLVQILLLSPLVVWMLVRGVRRTWQERRTWGSSLLFLGMGLPLAILLVVVGFMKESLPHWILPAVWMLLPLAALSNILVKGWLNRGNLTWCLILGIGLPIAASTPGIQSRLVAWSGNEPGPLAEFTLWPSVAEALPQWPESQLIRNAGAQCPSAGYLASLRWFWSSQLSWVLSGKPRVLNLDQSRYSYQHFRDANLRVRGCPVLIVGDLGHYDPEELKNIVDLTSERFVVLPSHRDRTLVVLLGTFNQDQLP